MFVFLSGLVARSAAVGSNSDFDFSGDDSSEDCSQLLWSVAVAVAYLWRVAVACCCGVSLWRIAVACFCGVLLWPVVVAYCTCLRRSLVEYKPQLGV